MEPGGVVGQLEVDPAAAVNRAGIAVMKVDRGPAVEGDLALFWFMPSQGEICSVRAWTNRAAGTARLSKIRFM